MLLALSNAQVVSAAEISQKSLYINTRSGRMLEDIAQKRIQNAIDCSHLTLYPGLINSHDHLELNHYPRTTWREHYANAKDWAADTQAHLTEEPYARLQAHPLKQRIWVGILKNLMSGVTTVAHHNPYPKGRYPIHLLKDYTWAHSLYLSSAEAIQQAHTTATKKNISFMIHLAEGTDAAAQNEFATLGDLGALSSKTILIHGVGLRDPNATEKAGGLVWCPSTNQFLLGQTAAVRNWFAAEKLALGSDSLLTADGDLLDELHAAHATGQLSAADLFRIVTDFPARLLNLPHSGELANGFWADIVALPRSNTPYQSLITAKRTDIEWVMKNGRIIWRRDDSHPNCLLDGVPYRLAPAWFRRVKRHKILPDGLQFL